MLRGKRLWRRVKRRHSAGDKRTDEAPEMKKIRPNRSVNDFDSKEDLKQALLSQNAQGSFCDSQMECFFSQKDDSHSAQVSKEEDLMKKVDDSLDWVLENYDSKTTNPQSLEKELSRLLVLKSYLVLDSERRQDFDRITEECSKRFNCPMAMISLVDLGRQWFLSKQGLDATETPRKVAFCAHAIQSSLDCFVIPDATQDVRFQNNPLVTGHPNVRFYAGAPLLSPEGQRLGMLCVVHTKPRPGGLTWEEQNQLKDLASKAVDALVEHRRMKLFWFNNLVKTNYPAMELEEVPSLEMESEDEAAQEEKYTYQPDPDVTDFLKINDSMTWTKVVSSLEKQVREQHLSGEYLQPFSALAVEKKTKPQKKRVRFAEDELFEGQVHADVYLVEDWKHLKGELWWSPEDMQEIRMDALRVVRFYVRHRPRYTRAIEILARGSQPRKIEEDIMKKITTEHSFVRGLESHCVGVLVDARKHTVNAVLKEQAECRCHDECYELTSDCLREESLLYSQIATRFAEKIGQCDHIEALKETMSRWAAAA